jgi:hypothetical protein
MRNQYLNEIYEAILESEIQESKEIDFKMLNGKLIKLMSRAQNDGLSEEHFLALVKSQLPEAYEQLRQTPLNVRNAA